ncbi:MAG: hypothetical protein H6974_00070 [Gammaproteobacteria bacterium]|nr:hypothetical protein [Gammaproteobacteria bacterium]
MAELNTWPIQRTIYAASRLNCRIGLFEMTDKRRPMPDIPQDIFAAILRGEKNEKSRKRSQKMVMRMKLWA